MMSGSILVVSGESILLCRPHTHTQSYNASTSAVTENNVCVRLYRKKITVMRALCQQLLPSPFSLLITACLDS